MWLVLGIFVPAFVRDVDECWHVGVGAHLHILRCSCHFTFGMPAIAIVGCLDRGRLVLIA
jgi:hypothetical protein